MNSPTTGITKNPTMPSSAPATTERVGTPDSRIRRPGSRYLAMLPTTTIATAMPSTHQPRASPRGTAHTAMPASTRISPGRTGTRMPISPAATSRPASSVMAGALRVSWLSDHPGEIALVVVGTHDGGGERHREQLASQLGDLVDGDRGDPVEALGDGALPAVVELGGPEPVHPGRGVLQAEDQPAAQVALRPGDLGRGQPTG